MAGLLGDLNKEQKKAVRHQEGPLLVVAGPGTGKTTVLTRHLAYLIQRGHYAPEDILALTFTQKAAREMADRVEELFSGEYLDLPVYTFHGWAQQLLEKHGLEIGLPVPFRVLADRDLRILMQRYWSRFSFDHYHPRGDNSFLISALINHFGRCKDEGIGPDDYLKSFRDKKPDKEERKRREELAEAYRVYQKLLLENGSLDFGDLLCYSYELLSRRPRLRRRYQEQIKHLLIDEFQDTNKIQYHLARMLAEPENNFVVCASADQTIYQWRGAYYGNVEHFLNDYPGAETVVLKNNYRSAQNLLDLSYFFIRQNDRFGRQGQENGLKAIKGRDGQIKVWRFSHKEDELRGVAAEAVRLIGQGVDPSEVAILTRTNDQVHAFEESLRQVGLPVQVSAAGEIYRQPIVLDLLAYLSLRVDRHDDAAFYRYLNFSCWNLSEADKSQLIHRSRRQGRSLAQVLERQPFLAELGVKSRRSARKMIDWLKDNPDRLAVSVYDFLEQSGYFASWLNSSPDQIEAEALRSFLEALGEFERNHPGLGLDHFLKQVEWERAVGDGAAFAEIPGAVRVMTVHGAKGLEFDHVFLVNLVDQSFPTKRQGEAIPWLGSKAEQRDHLCEERRLFFVAMTRARRGLYFSWAEDHGGQRMKKPSRFLAELNLVQGAEERKAKHVAAAQKKQNKVPVVLPDRFSYTQLASFRKCPYQYFLTHLRKAPTKGGPERSFGVTMHNTLTEFMTRWMRSKGKISWEELKEIYESSWLDDWYRNDDQRREFKTEGRRALKKFYRETVKSQPRVYEHRGQLWLEKGFRGELAGYPFRGKIDRVDQTEGGLELIDYKTGRMKEKLSTEDKEQLLVYQLAAEDILKIKPARLSFYYLSEGEKVSFLGTESEQEKVKEKIRRTTEQIRQSDFKAKPGFHCRYCDYRRFCRFRR